MCCVYVRSGFRQALEGAQVSLFYRINYVQRFTPNAKSRAASLVLHKKYVAMLADDALVGKESHHVDRGRGRDAVLATAPLSALTLLQVCHAG